MRTADRGMLLTWILKLNRLIFQHKSEDIALSYNQDVKQEPPSPPKPLSASQRWQHANTHRRWFINAAILSFARTLFVSGTNQAYDTSVAHLLARVREHKAFTEAQPGWQMLVEGRSLMGSLREAGQQQRKHWGEKLNFDISGGLLSKP